MRLHVQFHKQALDDSQANDEEPAVPQKRSKDPLEFHSLNEVTIMRNTDGMAQIEIFINNVLLTVVQGDG